MIGAVLGGVLDEKHHLGFTQWQASCRASGLRIATLFDFTWQLLPLALAGLLLGGLGVLAWGIVTRGRQRGGGECLAAHAGCALTLPLALLLCAMPLPLPLMMLVDVTLATLAALLLSAVLRRGSPPPALHP
jgi:hypothetical protein